MSDGSPLFSKGRRILASSGFLRSSVSGPLPTFLCEHCSLCDFGRIRLSVGPDCTQRLTSSASQDLPIHRIDGGGCEKFIGPKILL